MQSHVFGTPQHLAALDPKHNFVHLAGLPGLQFVTSPRNLVDQSLKRLEGQHDGGEKGAENQLI